MKIEFFSSVEGVAEAFPILPAQKSLPKWVNLARQDYLQNKQSQSVYRCPGIFDIMSTGFIVTAWHDIEVEPGVEMSGYAPSPLMEELLEKPPIQIQMGNSIAKHIPKRPWSHRDILKINTPWHVKAKCKFMMIPIPYSDEVIFESTTGIWDPSISSEINIQAYINTNQPFIIKAGQPICQLIPITEKNYTMEIRDLNDSDRRWLKTRKYINNMNFVLNRGIIKNAYNRFINK